MPSVPRLCSISNCQKTHEARGYCKLHYGRWRVHGDPNTVLKPVDRHGLKQTTEYVIYMNIIQRVSNPKSPAYKNYGGRGISLCQRWRESFRNFLADVGNRPSIDLTLDRKDNNGHYSCGKCTECIENGWVMNVRWATRGQQAANIRPRPNKTGYIGVRRTIEGLYVARISVSNRRITIGRYRLALEAARAYNEAADLYRGIDGPRNAV